MIFLLVLMPLQISWAALASYCQHESEAAATHFARHEHQHMDVESIDASPDPAKCEGGDSDCAACHASCAIVLADSVTIPLAADPSFGAADDRERLTPPPLECPERPKWRALA